MIQEMTDPYGKNFGRPTLTEFLLARIAEDEALAGAISNRQRVTWATTANTAAGVAGHDVGTFILFHDPARVLAECEAKRRIVDEHQATRRQDGYNYPLDPPCITCGQAYPRKFPCATIRALALPYVDHPDYREEWRP